jgi:hypothetical protein
MVNKSESIKEIALALNKAQKEMSNAIKDSKNPFFKSTYADLNSVREAVLPPLNNHGISVLQLTLTENGRNFVRTTLLHSSGEYICSDTEIVTSKQNDAQALGSAISYARRYGLQAMLCVGAVDDDAESTMVRQEKAPQPTQAVATQAPIPAQSETQKEEPKKRISFSKKIVTKPETEEEEI